MKKEWRRFWTLYHNMMMLMLIGGLAGLVVGGIVGGVLMPATEERWMPLGSLLGAVVLFMIRVCVAPLLDFPREYRMAVAMGMSRKHFLRNHLIESALQLLIILAVSAICYIIETHLYAAIYPGMEGNLWAPSHSDLMAILLMVAIIMTYELFVLVMQLVLGEKGNLVLVFSYFALMLTSNLLSKVGENGTILVEHTARIIAYVGALLICAAVSVLSVRALRKARVDL